MITVGVAWSQGQPKSGGTLVLIQAHPTWWNPLLESSAPFVNRILYMGLTDYDAKGEVVPGLAEKWSVSSDKLTYTFSLRKDVKWHDGRPFTSADVKFTFERILDPEVGSWLKGFFENVSQVETPDDHTAVVRLRAPSPTLLYNTWHGILPKHIWEKEDFKKSAYNCSAGRHRPVQAHAVAPQRPGHLRGQREFLSRPTLPGPCDLQEHDRQLGRRGRAGERRSRLSDALWHHRRSPVQPW